MNLEQSMKSAIETLGQLETLKAEVVELTATRDSLRDITAKLEQAETDWLKAIEKTAALRQQTEGEVATIKAKAIDEASKHAEGITSAAHASARDMISAASAQVEKAKAEYEDLQAKIAAGYAEHGEISDSLSAAMSRHESLTAEIDRLKKVVASI